MRTFVFMVIAAILPAMFILVSTTARAGETDLLQCGKQHHLSMETKS
jgi:hypothetical protein